MIPELSLQVGYDQNSPYHEFTLWEHTLKVVDGVPADINLRWAALLHDVGKPFVRLEKSDRSTYIKHDLLGAELVERIARHLKWSNDRREVVKAHVLNHMQESSPLREADRAAHLH
jgi:tRNA nucleotidyltransferase (CCA-adding enzyme)